MSAWNLLHKCRLTYADFMYLENLLNSGCVKPVMLLVQSSLTMETTTVTKTLSWPKAGDYTQVCIVSDSMNIRKKIQKTVVRILERCHRPIDRLSFLYQAMQMSGELKNADRLVSHGGRQASSLLKDKLVEQRTSLTNVNERRCQE